jgi:hypothetical protein
MPYWLLSILTNLVEVVMVFIAFYISLLGQMRKGFNSPFSRNNYFWSTILIHPYNHSIGSLFTYGLTQEKNKVTSGLVRFIAMFNIHSNSVV